MTSCIIVVIRSGDYYMFEDDSDDEESSLDQLEQLEPPSEAEGKVGPLEVTFLCIIHSELHCLRWLI